MDDNTAPAEAPNPDADLLAHIAKLDLERQRAVRELERRRIEREMQRRGLRLSDNEDEA